MIILHHIIGVFTGGLGAGAAAYLHENMGRKRQMKGKREGKRKREPPMHHIMAHHTTTISNISSLTSGHMTSRISHLHDGVGVGDGGAGAASPHR